MRRGTFKDETPVTLKCYRCREEFDAGRKHARFCSPKCRKSHSREQARWPGPGGAKGPSDSQGKPPAPPKSAAKQAHPWDAILTKGKADSGLAMTILGLKPPVTKNAAYAAFKRLVLEHHPDRGGDVKMTQWIYAAWDYLKAFHQWK